MGPHPGGRPKGKGDTFNLVAAANFSQVWGNQIPKKEGGAEELKVLSNKRENRFSVFENLQEETHIPSTSATTKRGGKGFQRSLLILPTPLPCQLTTPLPHYTLPCWLLHKNQTLIPSFYLNPSVKINSSHKKPLDKLHKKIHSIASPSSKQEKSPLPPWWSPIPRNSSTYPNLPPHHHLCLLQTPPNRV